MASNYPEQRRLSDVVPPLRTPDDDELSIIDVNAFDDTADEKWLYSTGSGSRRNSIETKIEDLDAWLHADVSEFETAQSDTNPRRSIDTRTFTRIKRRSNNRLSFDNIDDMFSPEARAPSNLWKTQTIVESPVQENNNITLKEGKDSVPMMLRPKTNQVLSTFLSESPSSIHSQASMDAFLNLAKSKEGMSLLSEMSDPDLSSFLMNVSQPSLLYSSIMSDGRNDENVQSTVAGGDSLVDSQILTDSMMEASMFKEVQDTTMIAEFLKQSNDDTMLVDRTFCKVSDTFDLNDKTFVNDPLNDKTCVYSEAMDLKSSDLTFTSNENSKSNDTFTSFPSPVSTDDANSTKILSSHENLLNSTQVISASNSLNSTRTISLDHLPQTKQDILSQTQTINTEYKTDLTFDLKSNSPSPSGGRLDATFETYKSPAKNIPRKSKSIENAPNTLDATYNAIPNLRAELLQQVRKSAGNKFDSTFTNAPLQGVEPVLDVTYDRPNSAEPSNGTPESLNATYVHVSPSHEFVSQNVQKGLDVTYDAPQQINSRLNSAYNMQRMSYANKNVEESQALGQNRFSTFKKTSKLGSRLSKAPQVVENHVKAPTVPLQPHVSNVQVNNNLNPQRFNTYRKSSSVKNNNIDDNNSNENKLESTFVKPAENKLESTFVKPAEKAQSRLPGPRQLSRLPSLFQKSNPNLGSNLRAPGKFGSETGLGSTFGKGSQPNIAGNMNTLSRFKSEGRLLQSKHHSELVKGDSTSRSMESIESTASAHSAPDLDDRLSLCSDSSRASYTIKPRNLETLKKLGSMEEGVCVGGKLGLSTPKVKGHTILENTWVQEKDLPSPILKNGKTFPASVDSRSLSPSDSAELAQTSSPLTISPANSDQAINAIGIDNADIEAKKENIQAVNNVQPKQLKAPAIVPPTNATKLRRPSNWTGGAKVANGAASGIPRPASRIPAPKFARPNLK